MEGRREHLQAVVVAITKLLQQIRRLTTSGPALIASFMLWDPTRQSSSSGTTTRQQQFVSSGAGGIEVYCTLVDWQVFGRT